MSGEIVGYRSYHTGRQIDEAVDRVLKEDDGIVFINSDQTITNKTINAPDNNITNLTLGNFDPNAISYDAKNVPQLEDTPDYEYTPKVATDLCVASYSPFLNGVDGNLPKIGSNDEMKSKFRNMGYALRDEKMHFCADNSYIFSSIKTDTLGMYNYNVKYVMFSPTYVYDEFVEQSFYEDPLPREELYAKHQENTVLNTFMVRAGNAWLVTNTFSIGINLSEYHDPNSETQRNYMSILGKGPLWLIPLTVYQVELKAIKNGETVFSRLAYTDAAGNSGSECTEKFFWYDWNKCHDKSTVEEMIWATHDTIEAKYTGKIFSGYRIIGDRDYTSDRYNFAVDSVENRDNSRPYREVLLPYDKYNIYQEVKDSQGHIGYVRSSWNDDWNTISGYANQPNDKVGEGMDIWKSLVPSDNPETWENTGDFKYTFRMFQGCDPHDTNKIAYKAYQLKDAIDGNTQWTSVAGNEGDPFYGLSSNEPNEVKWAYNNQLEWYKVNQGGQVYYVMGRDLVEYGHMELPPTTGAYVPKSIELFTDLRDINSYAHEAGFEDTTFEKNTPEVVYTYTGEATFIYHDSEDRDAEQYFSEDNWGIFKNNHDGTYTKIPEAYQWNLSSAYYDPSQVLRWHGARMHGKAPGGIPVMLVDRSVNGIMNWWITQAWEVQTEWEGKTVKGWTGIPPEGATVDMTNFSQFAGSPIMMPWYLPIESLSDNPPVETSIEWNGAFYTGNYEPDFEGRWTKIQNGEL